MTDSDFLQRLNDMASEEHLPDDCSMEHANALEQSSIPLRMPDYLKEQILERAAQPDIQVVTTPRHISRRMELFLYSCRVTAAVAASLLILLVTSLTQEPFHSTSEPPARVQVDVTGTITEHFSDSSQNITGWLQDFSKQMMHGNLQKKELKKTK